MHDLQSFPLLEEAVNETLSSYFRRWSLGEELCHGILASLPPQRLCRQSIAALNGLKLLREQGDIRMTWSHFEAIFHLYLGGVRHTSFLIYLLVSVEHRTFCFESPPPPSLRYSCKLPYNLKFKRALTLRFLQVVTLPCFSRTERLGSCHPSSSTFCLVSSCGTRNTGSWYHADLSFAVYVNNKVSKSILGSYGPNLNVASQFSRWHHAAACRLLDHWQLLDDCDELLYA